MQRRKTRRKRNSKPKICRFCESQIHYIDYLDADTLRRFQTEKGKILPRRITGTCLQHQKMLSTAIKRARIISLVL